MQASMTAASLVRAPACAAATASVNEATAITRTTLLLVGLYITDSSNDRASNLPMGPLYLRLEIATNDKNSLQAQFQSCGVCELGQQPLRERVHFGAFEILATID